MKTYFKTIQKISRGCLLTLLGWALLIAPANGQFGSDIYSNMSLEDLMNQVAISASKYGQTINDAPATVIIINQQEIVEQGYEDLSDILKDVCGVDVVEHARGFGEYYVIRGIEGNDRFLVLIDGHKLNPANGTFLSVGNSIPVRLANQIEIVFGPASAIYGADAFAGIINIITRPPDSENKREVRGSYAALNTFDGSFGADHWLTDDFSLQIFGRVHYSDGPDFRGRDPLYDVIDDYLPPRRAVFEQPIRDHNLLLKANYRNFNFGFFRQQFDEGNALGTVLSNNVYNKEYRWKLASNMWWATYHHTRAGLGHVVFDLSYTNYQQDPDTQFYKWVTANQFDEAFHQYMTGRSHTVRSSVVFDRSFSVAWQFVGGLESEYTTGIPPYANDAVFAQSVRYDGALADTIDDSLTISETRLAAYGQLSYSPTDLAVLVAGARYDHSDCYGSTINPRMGVIVNPSMATTAKFLYGTAFQAPSLFFQYEQWGSATFTMLSEAEVQKIEPDWELENQEISTLEMSLTHQYGDLMMLNGVVNYSELSNLIERAVFSDSVYNKYISTAGNPVYTAGIRNENIGTQKVTGLYVNARVNFSPKVVGDFSYSHTRAHKETDAGDENLPRIAKNKVWLSLTLRDLIPYLTVTSRLNWAGEINNLNDQFTDGAQSGYTIVNLNLVSNRLAHRLQLFTRIENLFDADIEHGGLFNQSGGYLPTIPQPGRHFQIGAEVSF